MLERNADNKTFFVSVMPFLEGNSVLLMVR